jgi:hypothetical protein
VSEKIAAPRHGGENWIRYEGKDCISMQPAKNFSLERLPMVKLRPIPKLQKSRML